MIRDSLLLLTSVGFLSVLPYVGLVAADPKPADNKPADGKASEGLTVNPFVDGGIVRGKGDSNAGTVIEFDEGSSLSRVLRMLALEAGLNYLDPKIDPNETVAFSLRGMSAKDAFYLVAKSRGFQVIETGGVVELVRSTAKSAEGLVSRSYVLKHVDARLVISSVANLLGISQPKIPARTSPAFPEPSASGTATTGGNSGGSTGGNGSSGVGGGGSTSSSGNSGGNGTSNGDNNGNGSGSGSLQSDGRFVPGLPMDTPLWVGGYDAKVKNSIYLDRVTNALVVRAPEALQNEVERYIATLDVYEPQIEITTRVIEIDAGKMRELGLDWSLGYTDPAHKLSGGTALKSGTLTANGIYSEIPAAAQAILSGWQVSMIMKAVQSKDHSSLVTDARVVTRSGIPAVVNNIVQEFIEVFTSTGLVSNTPAAGSSVPAGSNVSGTQSFQTGVVLDVLPRVLEDGRIDLNINPTVLSRIGQTRGASGQNLPIIVRRSTTTSVMVRDGLTVGIGGLMQVNESQGQKKIPVLGKIPVVGRLLFGSESSEAGRRNLVILVTPRLIREDTFNGAPSLPEAKAAAESAGAQMENPRPWVSRKTK